MLCSTERNWKHFSLLCKMQLGYGAELTIRSYAGENVSCSLFAFLSLNILLPSICFFFPLSCSAKKGDY